MFNATFFLPHTFPVMFGVTETSNLTEDNVPTVAITITTQSVVLRDIHSTQKYDDAMEHPDWSIHMTLEQATELAMAINQAEQDHHVRLAEIVRRNTVPLQHHTDRTED